MVFQKILFQEISLGEKNMYSLRKDEDEKKDVKPLQIKNCIEKIYEKHKKD